MTFIYVSVGNSDDRLSQKEWADYCTLVDAKLHNYASVYDTWYSLPQ